MLSKLIGEEAVKAWRFLDAKEVMIGGQNVFAVRITYTGELGWELYIPRQSVPSVYEGGGIHHISYSHTSVHSTFPENRPIGTLWIFIYNGLHKALNGLCKADFITWHNFDELLILAILEIKEGAVECYHSSRHCYSRLKIRRYPEKPNIKKGKLKCT